MRSLKRIKRKFFLKEIMIGSMALVSSKALAYSSTPSEIEGPFFPNELPKDSDFDLTQIKGNKGIAKGEVVFISGKVQDAKNNPLKNSVIILWQANSKGRYTHPRDKMNTSPIDPNFQGVATIKSDEKGEFRFKTIIPGSYRAAKNWMRPPHLHFNISKQGYKELTTQMYFPDNQLNKKDHLLNRKNIKERAFMIAKKVKGHKNSFQYNILLDKVTE